MIAEVILIIFKFTRLYLEALAHEYMIKPIPKNLAISFECPTKRIKPVWISIAKGLSNSMPLQIFEQ